MDNPFDENGDPTHAARMVWLVDELSNKLEIENRKKAAFAHYEAGNHDAALEILRDIPRDDETRSLLRAMRYDDEAKGIVSKIDPESEKYFADLAERLGIKKKET